MAPPTVSKEIPLPTAPGTASSTPPNPVPDSTDDFKSDLLALTIETPAGDLIKLDNINSQSSILDLMGLLAEYPALAHYTAYSLEELPADHGAPLKEKKKRLNMSKMVQSSLSEKQLDKTSLLSELSSTVHAFLRMVPSRYTLTTGQHHVRQVRKILSTPVNTSLVSSTIEADALLSSISDISIKRKKKKKKKISGQPISVETEPIVNSVGETDDNALADGKQNAILKERQQNMEKLLHTLHKKVKGIKVAIPTGLPSFFQEINEDGKPQAEQLVVIESVRSITFSAFNPPPPNRRMMGDLFYVEVCTLEGQTHHVTCTADGYFANATRNNIFNPAPVKKNGGLKHELLDLLKELSPSFKRCYLQLSNAFNATLKETLNGDPWKSLLNSTEVERNLNLSWNVEEIKGGSLETIHRQDRNRAEEHMSGMFGVDQRGALRDWNEEYQQCKDMPSTTMPDRLNRARSLWKIEQDFIGASKQGVQAIMSGYVQPINPMDPPNAYVYVFNNIFFSLSVPGGGRDAAGAVTEDGAADSIVSLKHDLHGVLGLNHADVPGLHTLATVVLDYMGQRIVAQSIIPGILQGEDCTKLVYGSVDQGKTIASDPVMHDLMKQAAGKMYIAERMVIPLSYNQSDSSSISEPNLSDEFVVVEDEASEVSENKSLPQNPLMKGAGSDPVSLCGPVDCKGIYGSDGRYYMLDLVRITPKDASFDEKGRLAIKESGDSHKLLDDDYGLNQTNETKPPTKVYLLRPELVRIYNERREEQAKKQALDRYLEEKKKDEAEKKTEGGHSEKAATTDDAKSESPNTEKAPAEPIKVYLAPLRLNTNTYGENVYFDTVVKPSDSKNLSSEPKEETTTVEANSSKIRKKDEDAVYDVAVFLRLVVLPKFISELRTRACQPVDGLSLCAEMHSRGINLRYMGYIANILRAADAAALKTGQEKKTPVIFVPRALYTVIEIEMISRSCRHYVSKILRETMTFRAVPAPLLARFFNLLLGGGNEAPSKPSRGYRGIETPISLSVNDSASKILPKSNSELWSFLKGDVAKRYTGYQLKDFENPSSPQRVALLRRVCQKLGIRVSSREYDFSLREAILPADIIDIVPTVKHGFPQNPLPEVGQLLEVGRIHLQRLQSRVALDVFQEALLFLYQTVGAVHEDVAACCQMIATAFFREGDVAQAIVHQRRAITVYEKLYGLDCAASIQGYSHLATMLQRIQKHDLAIKHLGRVIFFQNIMCGVPESTCTNNFMKLAILYQEARHWELALACYSEARKLSHENPLDEANCLHHLATLSFSLGRCDMALEYEQHAYKTFKALLGSDAKQTEQCKQVVKKFTAAVVARAKERQDQEAEEKAALAQKILMLEEEEKKAGVGYKKNKNKPTKQSKKSSGKLKRN